MTTLDLIVDVERRRLVKANGDFENELPAFVRGSKRGQSAHICKNRQKRMSGSDDKTVL